MCQCLWWLRKPLLSPSGTVVPSLPRTQAHRTCHTCLAPRHRQRRVKGSHSHLCVALQQPLHSAGAECPPLSKREGVEEGEQQCLCCMAGGAVPEDRAQSRETLTAWWWLSSFCRSWMDGRRVTRALDAPSGILGIGKGQGESWVSPKLPLLSCQPRGHLPSRGAVFPCPAAPAASPRLTPAACPATAPSARGSCRKRGEAASGPTAPQSMGRGERLRSRFPWRRTQGQDETPWGRREVLPKPWLRLSCQSRCFCLSLVGTKRGPGDVRGEIPPQPVHAGVLPAACPGCARRAEAIASMDTWAWLGTSPALAWDVAP